METFVEAFSECNIWRGIIVIFVMVGTNPYSFDRLVRSVDSLAAQYKWDVYIQLGHTSYIPKNCRYDAFVTREQMQDNISKSELVICHGGFGSIRDALAYNKPIVTVPRKPELNESQDYQEEMVKELEENNYLLAVYDIDDLEKTIEAARGFLPSKCQGSKIPSIINDYINS